MAKPRTRIGVDIGATTIKGAIVELSTGGVNARARAVTPRDRGAILDAAAEVARRLGAKAGRTPVGVASCGLVDKHGRVVETTDTMPDWEGVDLPAAFAGPFQCDGRPTAAVPPHDYSAICRDSIRPTPTEL